MVYSRIRKITFLYVFGATDSERKRGTTNYRKMNRQKKKESLLEFIYHGKKPERWPKTDVAGGLFRGLMSSLFLRQGIHN